MRASAVLNNVASLQKNYLIPSRSFIFATNKMQRKQEKEKFDLEIQDQNKFRDRFVTSMTATDKLFLPPCTLNIAVISFDMKSE